MEPVLVIEAGIDNDAVRGLPDGFDVVSVDVTNKDGELVRWVPAGTFEKEAVSV